MDTNFDEPTIQIINEIRLHLKLLTASDIVTLGSGSEILPNIYDAVNHRDSTLEWPETSSFPPTWIPLWRTALTVAILPLLQAKPLGPWMSTTHQTWKYKTSTTNDYIKRGNLFYKKITTTRRPNYRQCLEVEQTNILDLIFDSPADITIRHDTLQLLGSSYTYAEAPPQNTPINMITFYNNAPAWQKRIWGTAEID